VRAGDNVSWNCVFVERLLRSYDFGLATDEVCVRGSNGSKSRVREESCVDQGASVVDEVLAYQWRTQENGCRVVSRSDLDTRHNKSGVPPLQANAFPKVCSRTET
jgi:hypothetical protein